MTGWLAPFAAALDSLASPQRFFCRDDDGGWGDDALLALVAVHARNRVPLDVAVIPAAATPALAAQLRSHGELVGVHQHGFSHANHETSARRCEFGAARTASEQRADIEQGRARLRELFGPRVDPVFTPPWNRCTADTARALEALGFVALSRDVGAAPLGIDTALAELPVAIDWMKPRIADARDLEELGRRLAAATVSDAGRAPRRPLGLMFHHAVMTAADLRAVDSLLALLASHPNAMCVRMRDLLPPRRPAAVAPAEVDAA